MPLPVFNDLKKMIVRLGGSIVAKDHVAFFKDQLDEAKEAFEKLENEKATLEQKVQELQNKLQLYEIEENLQELNGALVKRLPNGSYSETPICTHCRSPMWAMKHGHIPFKCSKCKQLSNLFPSDLQAFLAQAKHQ